MKASAAAPGRAGDLRELLAFERAPVAAGELLGADTLEAVRLTEVVAARVSGDKPPASKCAEMKVLRKRISRILMQACTRFIIQYLHTLINLKWVELKVY